MNLRYSRQFSTSLRKPGPQDKRATRLALEVFAENPNEPSLHNHPLTAVMTGKRSFAVTDDLRVVFVERGNYQEVTLLDIGTHAAVYRR
jgi:mRNA-degrading endonuclease YafQ of YafQ-DinJ toxin-antitoxin module